VKLIDNFSEAKLELSRKVTADFTSVSPSLRKSLKEMFGTEDPEQAVRRIIAEVRTGGDAALKRLVRNIDRVELESLEVTKDEIKAAYDKVEPELVAALKLAAARIQSFHTRQKDGLKQLPVKDGAGQVIRPLERVGVYAPGGTASYPSTVLMTAVPARVAGVKEVILATSPMAGGGVPPITLVAADIAGVDRVFSIGGAQAVAALAYGTESVPKVDKICGPGNIFVVIAKKLVYGAVDIDGLQGPSEVLIIADETAVPEYCAADLLAQSEHDRLASSVLVATSRKIADAITSELKKQMASLPRQEVIRESLENNGLIAVVDTIEQAIDLANLYAPEHLCLMIKDAAGWAQRITNAGCVFIGPRPTVALGDYAAGPSHVLPTGGTARFSSPLNVTDFIKFINLVDIDDAGFKELGPAVIKIARAEGFEAHARAMEKRLSD